MAVMPEGGRDLQPLPPRVVLVEPEGAPVQTFVFENENHTLGNALRFVIMRRYGEPSNPTTVFCGYTIPHPAEPRMSLRVQTTGTSATDAVREGLNDLEDVARHMASTFEAAVEAFEGGAASAAADKADKASARRRTKSK